MPAAEAATVDTPEGATYELAFHVLPTVAEGEVPAVVTALKDKITAHGGSITDEEAPARFDLAYDIVQYIEGRNRRFSSAYFGWIRFTAAPEAVPELQVEIESSKELLRFLLVKLTKQEIAHPFYFHEALTEERSTTIEVDESTASVTAPTGDSETTESTSEESTTDTTDTTAATEDTAKPDAPEEAAADTQSAGEEAEKQV
ncbi:MAG: 30S ribosomal protein S6 [Patescibacteria group bacterium]